MSLHFSLISKKNKGLQSSHFWLCLMVLIFRYCLNIVELCRICGSRSSGYEEFCLVDVMACSLLQVNWRFGGTWVDLH
jgi:hypothetical protein